MIQLDIVTPTQKLVSAQCETVNLPGFKGELGILPEHTHLVTTVTTGVVKFVENQKPRTVAVRGGFAKVAKDQILLLVDQGLSGDGIDHATLSQESAELDRKLVSPDVGPDEREKLFDQRTWLNACLQLS